MIEEALAGNTRVVGFCPNCGKAIPARKGRGRRRIFCSEKCRSKYAREHLNQTLGSITGDLKSSVSSAWNDMASNTSNAMSNLQNTVSNGFNSMKYVVEGTMSGMQWNIENIPPREGRKTWCSIPPYPPITLSNPCKLIVFQFYQIDGNMQVWNPHRILKTV